MFKNKFSSILLILSVLIFIYLTYQSEIILGGKNRGYYLKYYFLSSILILFSIISFYLSKKLKEYLKIIIISCVFSIYAFQTYLTIYYGGVTGTRFIEKKISIAKKEGINFDYRKKIDVYTKLKNTKYKNLTTTISPSGHTKRNLDIFPLGGIANSKTINCNENGYYTLFQSDRYGFNNPDKEWDQNEIEFFLIGDSFILGNCVNRPHDISSVLRELSNKSVLNIGYSNNGPLIEYAGLKEYIIPNIKNIIWVYYENSDLNNLSRELNSKILKKYIEDTSFKQDLIYKQQEIDKILNKLVNNEINKQLNSRTTHYENKISFKIKKFVDLWNVREFLFLKERSNFKDKFSPPSEFTKIIKLAKNLAFKNKSNFYFVYLPSHHRYISKIDNQEYEFIKKTIKNLNINFIDIHKEVFKKEENPQKLFPFQLPGHYTIEGYRKVSEVIFNKL